MPKNEIIENERKLPSVPNYHREKNMKIAQRLKEESLQGNPAKRTGKKKKISRESYIRRLKIQFAIIFTAGIMMGALSATYIPHLIEKHQDNAVIGALLEDYQMNVIKPNSGRTDDNKYHFYDTMGIASTIAEAGEEYYDQNIFLTYCTIGNEETSEVIDILYRVFLKTGACKSFEQYITMRGYQDPDDFLQATRKKMLATKQIGELEAMLNEGNIEPSTITEVKRK